MSANNKCPVTGNGFCWKNPVHLIAFFAILPFAIKGASVLWQAVQNAVTTMAN